MCSFLSTHACPVWTTLFLVALVLDTPGSSGWDHRGERKDAYCVCAWSWWQAAGDLACRAEGMSTLVRWTDRTVGSLCS